MTWIGLTISVIVAILAIVVCEGKDKSIACFMCILFVLSGTTIGVVGDNYIAVKVELKQLKESCIRLGYARANRVVYEGFELRLPSQMAEKAEAKDSHRMIYQMNASGVMELVEGDAL